jgi:serine/threonine-protein kinase
MAPEQMQGRPIDVRADIWALGTILYQAVTGRHAFDGKTLPEVCAKVLGQDPPSLRSIKPQLPAELEQLVQRCLKKDPAERYADVSGFAAALAPFGSPGALRSMERINRVLKGSNAVLSKIGSAPTVAVGTTPMAGAATYASAPTPQTSNRLVLGLVVAAVVVIGAVTWALRSPSAPPVTAASPVVAPAAPIKATPLPAAQVVSPPPSTPSATAATPTTEGAIHGSPAVVTPSAAPSASAIPASKPKISAKPKPAAAKQPNLQEAWDPNNFGGRR